MIDFAAAADSKVTKDDPKNTECMKRLLLQVKNDPPAAAWVYVMRCYYSWITICILGEFLVCSFFILIVTDEINFWHHIFADVLWI